MIAQPTAAELRPLVPPKPDPAPERMSPLELARRMRMNGITVYALAAYDLRRTAPSAMARLGLPAHVIEAVLNRRRGQISGVAAVYNRHSYLLSVARGMS